MKNLRITIRLKHSTLLGCLQILEVLGNGEKRPATAVRNLLNAFVEYFRKEGKIPTYESELEALEELKGIVSGIPELSLSYEDLERTITEAIESNDEPQHLERKIKLE